MTLSSILVLAPEISGAGWISMIPSQSTQQLIKLGMMIATVVLLLLLLLLLRFSFEISLRSELSTAIENLGPCGVESIDKRLIFDIEPTTN